ncbi:MAG: beta-propeller fold lactonase family protein [Clostridia bacterium]|nr:beta-propeller fold lactonase family protein [Clostridia bacterium]
MSKEIFYVGSFEDKLTVCTFDSETLEMDIVNTVPHEHRPAQLCLNRETNRLYTANENSDGPGGVSSYDITDPYAPVLTGDIKPGNNGPGFISLSPDGKYLAGGLYFNGLVELYSLDDDHNVKEVCDKYELNTTGPIFHELFGQIRPRSHCAVFLGDTGLLAATDYAGDRLLIFSYRGGKLRIVSEYQFPAGEEIRHIERSPIFSDIIYVNSESASKAYSIRINEKGDIKVLCECDTYRGSEKNETAAIIMSSDGRHLYVSNRGPNTLAVIDVTGDGEKIELKGELTDTVGYCRDIGFSKNEEFMLTASMFENRVYLHRMDRSTGMPVYTGKYITVGTPTNVTFI